MPFFFIAPLWIGFVAVGLLLCFWPKFRFLTSYLLLVSTSGLLFSFALSLLALLILGKLFGGTKFAWVALLAYLIAIGIGGAVGIALGVAGARRVNVRMGWGKSPNESTRQVL